MTDEAKDLIKRLLDKSKDTRLGKNGVSEIISHTWFKHIDFEKLVKKELIPPY